MSCIKTKQQIFDFFFKRPSSTIHNKLKFIICSLMVRWVVGSILHVVDPMSYFSFQLVLHDWYNKGRGMCYSVCGMVHIAANRK